ncbi:hypothetical protein ACN47E_000752 [Coniothyrium glycines]
MFRLPPARMLQCTARARLVRTAPRFMSTSSIRSAQKDAQDKDSLKPRSTEYSKSGSDDEAAHSSTAFNPKQTKPEAEEATAESEAGGKDNSLNASPGNPDISQPNDPKVGGTSNAPDRQASGGGSAPKNG